MCDKKRVQYYFYVILILNDVLIYINFVKMIIIILTIIIIVYTFKKMKSLIYIILKWYIAVALGPWASHSEDRVEP